MSIKWKYESDHRWTGQEFLELRKIYILHLLNQRSLKGLNIENDHFPSV